MKKKFASEFPRKPTSPRGEARRAGRGRPPSPGAEEGPANSGQRQSRGDRRPPRPPRGPRAAVGRPRPGHSACPTLPAPGRTSPWAGPGRQQSSPGRDRAPPQEGAAAGDGESVLHCPLPETSAAAPRSRGLIFPLRAPSRRGSIAPPRDRATATYPARRLTPNRRLSGVHRAGGRARGGRAAGPARPAPPLPAVPGGRHGAGRGAARQAEARRDGAGRGAAPRLQAAAHGAGRRPAGGEEPLQAGGDRVLQGTAALPPV